MKRMKWPTNEAKMNYVKNFERKFKPKVFLHMIDNRAVKTYGGLQQHGKASGELYAPACYPCAWMFCAHRTQG
jgi:hypothetical protein